MRKIFILMIALTGTISLLRANDSTVVNGCQADFGYSYNNMEIMCLLPCSPIQFTDYSWGIAEAVHWSWDFGDGNYSDEQNPLHVYTFPFNQDGSTGPSEITVCLKVMFADSCMSEICQTVPLTPEPEKCYVYFWPYRSDSLVYFAGTDIIMYAFEVQYPEKTISFHWDFGDGEVSDEPHPVHGYSIMGGLYTVCLTISTEESCTQTYCTDLYVGGEDTVITPDCQAGFTYSVLESYPLQYAFTDISSGDPFEWFWDFGDGSYSTEANPVHVFKEKPWYTAEKRPDNSDPSGGIIYDSIPPEDYFVPVPPEFAYMVCLTVQTLSGCSSTYCEYVAAPYDTIPVTDPCNYRIRLNTSSILGVSCSGTATANLYDPVYGVDVPSSVYWSTGTYGGYVSGLCANMPYYVILTSSEGCTVAGSFAVMDYSVPVYTFGYWSYTGIGDNYRFAYNTPDSSYQCYWDFGDGVVLEGNEVDYTVTGEMTDPVSLKVYDSNGNLVHSEQIKVANTATGVDNPVDHTTRIYPNPVSDILYLELGDNDYENIDLMIIDMTGRMVRSQRLTGNGFEPYAIDVSDLSHGLYLARIMHGNQLIGSEKFLK